jgi:hypothetical protein
MRAFIFEIARLYTKKSFSGKPFSKKLLISSVFAARRMPGCGKINALAYSR